MIIPQQLTLAYQHLAFEGNIISGLRLHNVTTQDPAQSRYYVGPAESEHLFTQLIRTYYLTPLRFNPDPSRALAFIGYNQHHINHTLHLTPVPGHYIDWDYEVTRRLRYAIQPDRYGGYEDVRYSNMSMSIVMMAVGTSASTTPDPATNPTPKPFAWWVEAGVLGFCPLCRGTSISLAVDNDPSDPRLNSKLKSTTGKTLYVCCNEPRCLDGEGTGTGKGKGTATSSSRRKPKPIKRKAKAATKPEPVKPLTGKALMLEALKSRR